MNVQKTRLVSTSKIAAAIVFAASASACNSRLGCVDDCSGPDVYVSPSRNLTPVEEIGRLGSREINGRSIPVYSVSDTFADLISQSSAYVVERGPNFTRLSIGTSVDFSIAVSADVATGYFGFRGTAYTNSESVSGFGIDSQRVFVDVSEGIEIPSRTHHRVCALGSSVPGFPNEVFAFCTNIQIRPVGYTRYELAVVRSP